MTRRVVKTLLILIAVPLFLVASTSVVLAAADDACTGDAANSAYCQQILNPDPQKDPFIDMLQRVSTIFAYVGGFLAILYIIQSGFKFVTSQGDPGKAAEAKMTMLYAVAGLVVLVAARVIIIFIVNNLK